MPAPTNISALTATDIGPLPATIVQDAAFGGTAYTLWFQYTAQAGDDDIGVWGFGDPATYDPYLSVYLGPASAPVEYLDGALIDVADIPIVMPVTPGTTYYFKIAPDPNLPPNPSPAVVTLSVLLAPQIAQADGLILITEFAFDGDAALVSPLTGQVVGYRRLLGPSDDGDVLPSGIFAVTNGDSDMVDLYTPQFASISSVGGVGGEPTVVSSDRSHTFFYGRSIHNVILTLTSVSDTGVPGGTTWTFPTNSKDTECLAVSRDGMTAYYVVLNPTGDPIRAYDLAGNAPLPDFAMVPFVGAHPEKDLYALADGGLLAGWSNSGTGSATIIRYDNAGSEVWSRVLATGLDRFFLTTDDRFVWVETQTSTTATFIKLDMADGSVLFTTPNVTPIFNVGISADETPTPDMARFGISNSCPLLALPSSSTITFVQPPRCGGTTTQRITIHGSGFPDDPTVTAIDPQGNPVSVSIVSSTSTDITVSGVFLPCGIYTFSVSGSAGFEVESIAVQAFPIRRQRRCLLPSSPDNKVMRIPYLELLMRTGIGLPPGAASDPPVLGSDPQVMLRISKDGGKTWLPEQWRSVGKLGEYLTRVRWLRTPNAYRNAVVEITISDPVDVQMLALIGDPMEGSS